MKAMPPVIVAMAGDAATLGKASGWLHMKYFATLPVIFGPFAVMSGAGLLASDEERGRLDLLMAYPTARWKIFYGRLLALYTATALIHLISWLGLIAALPFSKLEITPAQALLPFASLFALMILFESFALLLSFVLPSRILAAGAAGIVLVANFFIHALAPITPVLKPIARWLPYHFYQGGEAADGFQFVPFITLLTVAAFFVGASCLRFQFRDIRVMGERTMRWPWQRKTIADPPPSR